MLIVNELRKNNLVFAIKETLNQPGLDADDIIKQADLPRYSAVIVVGGDGTIHKTVNGMLQRSDGLSLPIGLLPNGSGNDTCRGLSYSTVQDGLKHILKADTIKYDIFKILIDYDTEEELDEAIKSDPSITKEDHLRYCVINSCLCMAANTSKNVGALKQLIGGAAYSVVGFSEMVKRRSEVFDFEIDEGVKIENVRT